MVISSPFYGGRGSKYQLNTEISIFKVYHRLKAPLSFSLFFLMFHLQVYICTICVPATCGAQKKVVFDPQELGVRMVVVSHNIGAGTEPSEGAASALNQPQGCRHFLE